MSPLRIFISSVQKELAPERAALRDHDIKESNAIAYLEKQTKKPAAKTE